MTTHREPQIEKRPVARNINRPTGQSINGSTNEDINRKSSDELSHTYIYKHKGWRMLEVNSVFRNVTEMFNFLQFNFQPVASLLCLQTCV
jgi:hypothetical protein